MTAAAGLQTGLLVLVAVVVGSASGPEGPGPGAGTTKVVFACRHGNVKSVMASEWFNRLAARRGGAARSIARGLAPDGPVPDPIVRRLGREGFDVRRFEPRPLSHEDLDGATRLVMIGVEPPPWASSAGVPVEEWNAIPPATERYEAARAAILTRIVALLEALAVRGPAR